MPIFQGKRWLVSPAITLEAYEALAAYTPIMRQLLFNRGYATMETAQAYLKAETNFDPSPMQMTGMPGCVDRICYALKQNEAIAIYGDYDVDGVTATALLVQALRLMRLSWLLRFRPEDTSFVPLA